MRKVLLLLFYLLLSSCVKKKSVEMLFQEAIQKRDSLIQVHSKNIAKQNKIDILFDTLNTDAYFTIDYQKKFKKNPKILILNQVEDIIDSDTCMYIYIRQKYKKNFIRIKSKNKFLVEELYRKTDRNERNKNFIVASVRNVSKYVIGYIPEYDGTEKDGFPEGRITIEEMSHSLFFDADLDTIYFSNIDKEVKFPSLNEYTD